MKNTTSKPEAKKPYERPEMVWEEIYEPIAFGVSCAKEPGNPQCGGGPLQS